MNYVQQDHREHYVKELVVPANSGELSIQIALEPRVSFLQRELYFGCSEKLVNEENSRATEWFVPFIREGLRRTGKPDDGHPGHYTDYNGFYHIREDYLYTSDVRIIGFKLVTTKSEIYPVQIFTVTDDVRGKTELVIKVEDPQKTKMRCHMKGHRRCVITPGTCVTP
jgi:hypothetical protein